MIKHYAQGIIDRGQDTVKIYDTSIDSLIVYDILNSLAPSTRATFILFTTVEVPPSTNIQIYKFEPVKVDLVVGLASLPTIVNDMVKTLLLRGALGLFTYYDHYAAKNSSLVMLDCPNWLPEPMSQIIVSVEDTEVVVPICNHIRCLEQVDALGFEYSVSSLSRSKVMDLKDSYIVQYESALTKHLHHYTKMTLVCAPEITAKPTPLNQDYMELPKIFSFPDLEIDVPEVLSTFTLLTSVKLPGEQALVTITPGSVRNVVVHTESRSYILSARARHTMELQVTLTGNYPLDKRMYLDDLVSFPDHPRFKRLNYLQRLSLVKQSLNWVFIRPRTWKPFNWKKKDPGSPTFSGNRVMTINESYRTDSYPYLKSYLHSVDFIPTL